MLTESTVSWDITACSLLKVNRRFGGTLCIHLQGRISREWYQLVSRWLDLPPALTLVSFLAYFSSIKMEAICSSETSVEFQQTTRRCIPVDRTVHNNRCENLKSYTLTEVCRYFLSASPSSSFVDSNFLEDCPLKSVGKLKYWYINQIYYRLRYSRVLL
jgi:hypothetical protein